MEKKIPKELWIRRAFLLGTLITFVLPLLRVEDCNTHEITTYTGYEVLTRSDGYYLFVSIAVALLLLGLSFIPYPTDPLRRAFGACWRAILSAFAGWWCGIMSMLLFLFDHITPHVGWFVGIASWVGVGITGWVTGIQALVAYKREPEGIPPPDRFSLLQPLFRATAILALVIPFIVAAVLAEEGIEILAAVGTVVFASVPLAVSLECCGRASLDEERWAIGWGITTTILAWAIMVYALLIAVE